MKIVLALAFAASFIVLPPGLAEGKCYNFSAAPSDVGVCVGKNGSDSFDDRKRAQSICKSKLPKGCGNISSFSTSCHSSTNQCFDESGNAHRDLSGY